MVIVSTPRQNVLDIGGFSRDVVCLGCSFARPPAYGWYLWSSSCSGDVMWLWLWLKVVESIGRAATLKACFSRGMACGEQECAMRDCGNVPPRLFASNSVERLR